MAALPADLRAVMKSTTKYTDNTGGGSDNASYVTATTDYLFLLAEFEVFGQRYGANSAEQNYQKQYDYYKAGNSRVAYNHTAVTTAVWWWLRSPNYNNSNTFRNVNTDGGYNRRDHCCVVVVAFPLLRHQLQFLWCVRQRRHRQLQCFLVGGCAPRLFRLILRRVSRPPPAPARGRTGRPGQKPARKGRNMEGA